MNLQAMAKQIEFWVLDKLIPYARNPRTHSDAQVAQIAASIAEFGFNNPILVDTRAGVIAGHGRLLAARQLGLEQIPVIVLDHLSEMQKRAYVIADNRLALNAGWDEEMLKLELAALQQEDFDIALIGFEDDELARLLAGQDAAEGLTDEDAVPDLPELPITVSGDLWIPAISYGTIALIWSEDTYVVKASTPLKRTFVLASPCASPPDATGVDGPSPEP
jgi:hypothetical protein